MSWWMHRLGSELKVRICLALDLEGPLRTDALQDHWMVYPFQDDKHLQRCLTQLRKDGVVRGAPVEPKGKYVWELTSPGVRPDFRASISVAGFESKG